nr:hypothetical protein [Tanacetum cinerariifolium]
SFDQLEIGNSVHKFRDFQAFRSSLHIPAFERVPPHEFLRGFSISLLDIVNVNQVFDAFFLLELLPIIDEKVHQEKVQQEKLKAVKASLNFEEASQYSELGAPSRRRSLKERIGSRHARSVSGSPVPRGDHSESPRKRGLERRTVFKRLEKGVFHRLGDKGKGTSAYSNDSKHRSYHSSRRDTKSCYQSSRSRETKFVSEKRHNKRTSSRRTEACRKTKVAQEDNESQSQRGKSRVLKTTCPNRGCAKKQILSLLEFVTLTFQKHECLAISRHTTEAKTQRIT